MSDITLLLTSPHFDQNTLTALETAVQDLYGTDNNRRMIANNVLNEYMELPNSWLIVDKVLDNSPNPNTKFYALSLLEKAINKRWNLLPEENKIAVKNFICKKVVELGTQNALDHTQNHYLTKLNAILVAIVKREWNTTWKTFIPEICASSKANQDLCENTMILLKLLSEEIFDFSKETINSKKAKALKETMIKEFSEVFQLCLIVLQNYFQNKAAVKFTLVKSTLQTLAAFMSWIPIAYIFQTNLYKFLIEMLGTPNLRVETLKCIAEIANIKLSDQEKLDHTKLFFMLTVKIEAILDNKQIDVEFTKAKQSSALQGIENFSLQLLNSYTCFLNNNITIIDSLVRNPSCPPEERANIILSVYNALERIIQISQINIEEIFKASMEFWCTFVSSVFSLNTTRVMANQDILCIATLEANAYQKIFSKLRRILMCKMARPSEVLVTVDEYGNVEQKQVEDTEMNSLYELMQSTLRILAIIDQSDTIAQIFEMLDYTTKEVINNGKQEQLARFCFSIGSIHNCIQSEDESTFLVAVIKELLTIVEKLTGKGNKAAVAADIMYVVGSYPSFLRMHWKFNKTVIRKLNEFMRETFPGVQDMACETFIKIAKKCSDCFTRIQENESSMFIDTLILTFNEDTSVLNQAQLIIYYESLSIMINSHPSLEVKQRLLQKLLVAPYTQWNHIIEECGADGNLIFNVKTIKDFDYFLRINQAVAKSVGFAYSCIFKALYSNLLNIYKCYSNTISVGAQKLGDKSLTDPILKCMRTLRHNILRLFSIFYSNIDNKALMADFLPQMMLLLNEFSTNDPNAKDAEILSLFASLIDILKDEFKSAIPEIMTKLAAPTLQMITTNFEAFPDHRRHYFELLSSLVCSCFSGLISMDIAGTKVIMDSLIWGIKHQDPLLSELNLSTIISFLTNCSANIDLLNTILGHFYMPICQDIFYILTDALHKSGFKQQTQILQFLIKAVCENQLRVPVCEEAKSSSNKEFLSGFLNKALSATFPNVSSSEIALFISTMFATCNDYNTFKENVRNFLIDIKEFGVLEQKKEVVVNIDINSEEVKKVQALMSVKKGS